MRDVNWTANSRGMEYHFYIHGVIECSEDYTDLLDTLYTASEEDILYMHINTAGGSLDTTVEIIHAMAQTKASIITCADGLVASAGSLLFFSGHGFEIGEFCEVMLHDGSGGDFGKVNENLKSAQFTSNRLANIYRKVYGPFFTEAEVDGILEGRDLYLTADEVGDRLSVHNEKMLEEEEADADEE